MLPNKIRTLVILWITAALAAGCSHSGDQPIELTATSRPTSSLFLTPYSSPTASVTPTPTQNATPTALPSPTPTPLTHIVAKGEDLSGIALRYHLTLDELLAANPGVNPHFLKIGSTLSVPQSKTPIPTSELTQVAITATPLPVETGALECLASAEGGVWCFLPVKNTQSAAVEDLSAVFRILNAQTHQIRTETGFLPVDILPPGASLPLIAYFAPPVEAPFQAGAEMLSALPKPTTDKRYLAVEIQDQQVNIDDSGQSASITLELVLTQPGTQARRIRVAAISYAADGRINGFRLWENESASPLLEEKALPLSMQIYSLFGVIQRVEVYAEARP